MIYRPFKQSFADRFVDEISLLFNVELYPEVRIKLHVISVASKTPILFS